jgi:transcriptional regulator
MIEETKFKELHKKGMTMQEMANELSCSYASVYQTHKSLNLEPNKKSNERHAKILELVKEHPELSYEEIGKLVNCTRQNVSVVCLEKHKIRRRNTDGSLTK